jgi:nitrogen PTS system EIIA component
MKIRDIIKKEYIIEDLVSTTGKREILAELSSMLFKGQYSFDEETVISTLMNRENLGSTGIGDGIAIPHGKIEGLDKLLLLFGRSRRGVDFHAMDGKPVHLFFLLVAPENSEGRHLRALAKISRMLKDAAFRKKLLDALSGDELFEVISEKDKSDQKP